MLVVDSSAIIAMMFDEPESPTCAKALAGSIRRLVSAANYVEAGTVIAGRAEKGDRDKAIADLDAFLTTFRIEVAPVDEEQAFMALRARIKYGKGFGAAAGLNYGDTFAYALAKANDAPLLFIGDDFTKTDIKSAP